jgi:hypothetical protein
MLTSPRTLIEDLVQQAVAQGVAEGSGRIVAFGAPRQVPLSGGFYSGVQLSG